jgi:hypothetical protein
VISFFASVPHHQLIAALNFIERTIEISGVVNEMLQIDD